MQRLSEVHVHSLPSLHAEEHAHHQPGASREPAQSTPCPRANQPRTAGVGGAT